METAKKACIAIVVLSLVFVVIATALISHVAVIHNHADVETIGVEVYKDSELTDPLTTIDWGVLKPGQTTNYTGYILSTSNVPIVLRMETLNWIPNSTVNYIECIWNIEGTSLDPDESSAMMFTLTVYNNITGITHFEFDIVVGSF